MFCWLLMWLGFVNFVFIFNYILGTYYYLFCLSLEPCVLCVCFVSGSLSFCSPALLLLSFCLSFCVPPCLSLSLPSLSHVCFIVFCVGLSGDPATSPLFSPFPFFFALWPEFKVESASPIHPCLPSGRIMVGLSKSPSMACWRGLD